MNYLTALVQLPLARESTGQTVRTPADVRKVCEDLENLAQEVFQVLTLNVKNHLLNRHMISLGLADSSLAHPREIFRSAIADGASSIILVHNHPSHDETPSAEDIRLTRVLVEAGKVIQITVLDHIIIGQANDNGSPGYYSLREAGLVAF